LVSLMSSNASLRLADFSVEDWICARAIRVMADGIGD
jgi:hypothetical protein